MMEDNDNGFIILSAASSQWFEESEKCARAKISQVSSLDRTA
ncbi:MAG: hypothetical protein ACD_60C00140G0002 [uncultured bacterium]|nr:MAG: hypothetical protein ACD_60C00140G0002 [uncultured bacterium]